MPYEAAIAKTDRRMTPNKTRITDKPKAKNKIKPVKEYKREMKLSERYCSRKDTKEGIGKGNY